MRAFDTIVIGAGQAGVPLSRVLAGRGQRVALVERARPGGSCVNFGCTPTKAMIASARIARQVRTAAAWGVQVSGSAVDFPAVMRRVRGLVSDAVSSLERDLGGAGDPVLVRGEARLDGREGQGGPIRVSVHGDAGIESFSARNVVLDTGTRTAIPDLPGLDADRPDPRLVTAETWVDLDVLPARLLVLGGSTLGLEFAQAFSRLGAAVTVLQDGHRLAPQEDPDISEAIRDILRAEGLQVRLGVAVERVEWRPDGVRLHLRDGGTVDGSHLLVATGRRTNTGSLGLDTLDLEPDEHGRVPVDDRLRTPVSGLWAAGDITPGLQFTHLAYADHAVIAAAM
ncbi:MAG: FAD-dependent oxidoreductase, partial [Gluconacetobacter diazotrophicus]|nr:FAD-dependent oxidoreductase [Gluconacetobacter diazotrophicus]